MRDDDLKLLSYKDLTDLGYGSKSTVNRRIKVGKFPKPDLDMSAGEGPPQPRWRSGTLREYQKTVTIASKTKNLPQKYATREGA